MQTRFRSLGIISRETRAGAVLPSSGFGFDGHGYGLMQVTECSD